MRLGQEIGDMVEAVRGRVEVSWHGGVWHITAGTFDAALAYARERFDEPVVLSRQDRGRWWPRVTLVVTDDRSYAASAPSLDDLAHPAEPDVGDGPEVLATDNGSDVAVLEEIFARQEARATAVHRVPRQRRRH